MILIKGAGVVNEGTIAVKDVLIKGDLIDTIGENLQQDGAEIIDARGMLLMPGVIDDQVHFREPGLTHKAEIATESKAAVAGGITSYMEMPNTNPQSVTQELLQAKYDRAAEVSVANYSFFMGATNDNLEEVLKTDKTNVCGIKVFMGSSTGNMLVDNRDVLEGLFSSTEMLIATHCEDEETIRANTKAAKEKYGEDVPMWMHPVIRNEEACYRSSSMAAELAAKYNTRLHILHISTAKELSLFSNKKPLSEKTLTSEACVHHMWFDDSQYETKGSLIKWNPAVKSLKDRDAIRQAVNDNVIDVVATDHAPHTKEEKANSYFSAPSGGPLVQHSLQSMLEMYTQGVFSLEKIVQKMAHHPAELFRIEKRGYIREGYFADLVLVNPNLSEVVKGDDTFYKCKWSPFEGQTFSHTIAKTLVNGKVVYENGKVNDSIRGMRLKFNR